MKRIIVAACLLFSAASAHAQGKPALVVDDQTIITGVNKPGAPTFDALTVENGDQISFAKYTPTKADQAVGIAANGSYNMFILTKKDKSQAFIVWSSKDPVWQERLLKTNTVVKGIGAPGPNVLKRGDKAKISVGDAEGGGWGVTLDVRRGNTWVATFSFVIK